jgi:hypothetical protein
MKAIHFRALTAAILVTGGVAWGADEGGVLVTFKAGSPETLPPDGTSQTVLEVRIDPKAKAWGGPVDVKTGRFSVDVQWYGKSKISPKQIADAKFPVHITVTSWQPPKGVTRHRAAAVITVTYHPPGDRTGRNAKSCTGRAYVTVSSKPAKPVTPKRSKEAELIAAVRSGDTKAVAKLLSEGANPNVRDARHGWFPLHFAVVSSPKMSQAAMVRTRMEMIQLLVNAGAYVSLRGKQLDTPLHLAAVKGQSTDVVRLLLDLGADVTARMRWGTDPKTKVSVLAYDAATQAPTPWNQQIREVLKAAIDDTGWEPTHEYANCHSYTIFLLTGEHRKRFFDKLQSAALETALRDRGYLALSHRSRGVKLKDKAILSRLRHGDVLILGTRHSATARQGSDGLRFHHFTGLTQYDLKGNVISRNDLGRVIKTDPATGKRTYVPRIDSGIPGSKTYKVHCSPRDKIAATALGTRLYGEDPPVIWRRLGQHKRGSWYLVADDTTFTSASNTGFSEKQKRAFSERFDVTGKFEDKPGTNGITFTGTRKVTDPKSGVSDEAEITAVFDDRMVKLVSLEIKHVRVVPDRGAIKGSRMNLDLKAKDIEVKRVSDSVVFCRTPVPRAVISDIKHTIHRGRWVTTLDKVGNGRVTWLEITFDDGPSPPKP